MPNFPDTIETRSHESNADVNNVGGTYLDAADQNWVYDLLEALETWVGPSTDTSATDSHEGRIKLLEETALVNPMDTLGQLIRAAADGVPEALDIGTTGQVLTVVAGVPAWAAPGGGGDLVDPMTATGDLIYQASSGDPTRLGIGAAGQFLGISGGLPAWTTPNYVPAPGSPQQGDVLYYNGTAWTRLGPGTTGQFLKTLGASSNPVWATPPSAAPGDGIPAPVGQAQGDILYFDGDDWLSLPAGTSGQFLKTLGAGANPEWATPAGGGDMDNPMTTLSDMIYADTGGAPLRLPIGSANTILQVVGGAPAWASLGGQVVPTYFDWTYQGSAPATPAASTGRTYWKTDGKFYGKNAAGTEYDLTQAPGAGSKHTIYDETNPLTARTRLTFLGGGVDASDNAGDDSSDVLIPGYYGQVKVDGSSQTLRHTLDLIAGTGVTLTPVDNSGGDATEVTIDATGGGGGNPFTQPTVPGSPTWLNQGGATVTTLTAGLQFNYPSGGTGHTYRGILLETGVGATWTRYISFDMNADPSLNTPSIGLLAYASGSGQFYHIGLASSSSDGRLQINIDRFTNTTTLATNRLNVRLLGPNRAWFRVEATGGGNLTVDLSYDGGQYWRNILSDSISSFFGANAIDGLGFGMDNNSTGSAFVSTLRSYGSTAPDPTVAQ